jgi:hypothetical protein
MRIDCSRDFYELLCRTGVNIRSSSESIENEAVCHPTTLLYRQVEEEKTPYKKEAVIANCRGHDVDII